MSLSLSLLPSHEENEKNNRNRNHAAHHLAIDTNPIPEGAMPPAHVQRQLEAQDAVSISCKERDVAGFCIIVSRPSGSGGWLHADHGKTSQKKIQVQSTRHRTLDRARTVVYLGMNLGRTIV